MIKKLFNPIKRFFVLQEKNISDLKTLKKIEEKLLEEKLIEDKKILFEENDIEKISETLKKIDQPIIIPLNKHNEDKMIKNPLKENNYISTNKDIYKTKEDITIRLKDNKKATEIFKTGKFSLEEKEIQLKENNLNQLYFSGSKSFKSFSLGDVNVFDKNTIFIDDLDIDKIPKDIDIELDEKKKEIYFVGKKIGEGEEIDGKERIDNEIFHEENLQEKLSKKLNFLENFVIFDFKLQTFKWSIKYLPILVFLVSCLDTYFELNATKKTVHVIEEQKVLALERLKLKYS